MNRLRLIESDKFEPSHETMAHFSSVNSNQHAQASSGARCLIFGRTLRLLPYFMCANSKGSGETARMRRLTKACAGRLCDKYHSLMSWLIYTLYNFLLRNLLLALPRYHMFKGKHRDQEGREKDNWKEGLSVC